MGWQNHAAGTKGDAISWVCGDVVQDLVDDVVGGLGGHGFLLAQLTQCNKEFVVESELCQQQATAINATNDSIQQLLDYVATYPADGITFRASDMVLSAHSNAAYLNVSKARSRAGSHIMMSEDVPVPK